MGDDGAKETFSVLTCACQLDSERWLAPSVKRIGDLLGLLVLA